MTHVQFDGSLDVDNGNFEFALRGALAKLATDDTTLGLHMPYADEMAELTYGEHEFTREIDSADWVVLGKDIDSLMRQVRALIGD